MKICIVGGAVRDELLGLPVTDRDYVVVGATPEEMVAQGFKPVGKDFPVFLHPETHEEYALARTERKTARGYKGFQVFASPEVTLEEDLARRDLTINAIAKDESGSFIDPYNGAADLKAGILRHVSPAFVEDPVRVLRVARFAARFGFSIAPETLVLMREMAANGEVDALVPERVWQELSRGLMEKVPSRMFHALRECGALVRILPELDRLFGVPQTAEYHPEIDTGVHVMMALDYAAAQNDSLPVRFAVLTHDLGKGTTPHEMLPRHIDHESRSFALLKPLCQRLRVSNDCRELALVVARFHGLPLRAFDLRPETLLDLLLDTDALRQPQRFEEFLQACTADFCGRLGYQDAAFSQADFLRRAHRAVQAVDAGAVALQCPDPATIRDRVYQARLAALGTWLAANR
ncbi:MAG TPA: multifunctional CCA addition/repair protein [Sulfuricella sp.]|nr:multifunctional CCA addition/repair protein [Sulfuricella sp.]